MRDRIRSLNQKYYEWIVDARRRLHQCAELAFEEHQTSRLIEEELEGIGLEVTSGVNRTGIISEITGAKPGRTRILRADMDALPITEQTGLPFESTNAGVMHACGHDAHMASLLGAARILHEMRDDLQGTVRLIFQPSEEKHPGGAPGMIDEGALGPDTEGSEPSFILGQHVFPDLPTGVVGVRGGPFMASADEIYLTIRGEGGHAANPDALRADAVLVQAHILIALQSVISRNRPPDAPSVLSFGKVLAAGATNVIPEVVHIEGTLRAMDEGWRRKAHDLIRRTATQTAEAFGATCEVDILVGYPPLVNDVDLAARMHEAAAKYLGKDRVLEVPMWFAAEDFAYYTEEMRGCFYVIGVRNEEASLTHGLHTSRFSVDEEVLRTAPGLMAYAALTIEV